jgi:hypothetical protein
MIPKIDNAIRTIILTGDAQTDLYIRIGITIALIIIVFLAFKLARYLDNFSQELEALNSIIHKTEGEERKFWENRKKKLLRSLFLFQKYDD